MIQVFYFQRQRAAGGAPRHHPGENLHPVVFQLHARPGPIAGLPPGKVGIDTFGIQRQPGRHPFQDGDQGRAVRFSSG